MSEDFVIFTLELHISNVGPNHANEANWLYFNPAVFWRLPYSRCNTHVQQHLNMLG